MKFILFLLCFVFVFCTGSYSQQIEYSIKIKSSRSVRHDVSRRLSSDLKISEKRNHKEREEEFNEEEEENRLHPGTNVKKEGQRPYMPTEGTTPEGDAAEQTYFATKPAAELIASFDGLGESFTGPQGTATLRNPSDNSLAVGLNHIVQIVNSRMAIFTKKGKMFDSSGRVLYGPGETRNVFKGFGGPCERTNNGDAVVRYDQLADRWLIVMPIFRRVMSRNLDSLGKPLPVPLPQPGKAEKLYEPTQEEQRRNIPPRPQGQGRPQNEVGDYCMCYALSTGPDPFGPYYRYEFVRKLFPDYPRPAVWPDGYYNTTSTGDDVIQKHAYVVDRAKMLKGEDATEQSFIISDVNFLINADLDGKQLPPKGAPSIMLAAGGTQLKQVLKDDGIYAWKFHVDWKDPSKTSLTGPKKITVAPYQYLCGGQLTKCVPQPGTDQRLDAQGDKLMARLVYRRIGKQESLVAVHSVNTSSGGGGVRWYEFRLDKERDVNLYQQGTYAPDGQYRWLPSPAMDGKGNIGIGYSYGGSSIFPGQRFTGRLANDSLGVLTLHEAVLVEGEASQTNTLRWEDYTQTAMDPSDDATIWYVGDYLKKNATNYSTKIGAFKIQVDKENSKKK